MAIIIAARLQLQSQADEAIAQLNHAGFAPGKMTAFYVNPPGQHAVYPIGGDRFQSPGESPLGGQVDAHVETIVETLFQIQSPEGQTAEAVSSADAVELRKAGMLVAVEVADEAGQNRAIALFTDLGAENMEKAQGEIVDGEWRDFDPLSEPCYI